MGRLRTGSAQAQGPRPQTRSATAAFRRPAVVRFARVPRKRKGCGARHQKLRNSVAPHSVLRVILSSARAAVRVVNRVGSRNPMSSTRTASPLCGGSSEAAQARGPCPQHRSVTTAFRRPEGVRCAAVAQKPHRPPFAASIESRNPMSSTRTASPLCGGSSEGSTVSPRSSNSRRDLNSSSKIGQARTPGSSNWFSKWPHTQLEYCLRQGIRAAENERTEVFIPVTGRRDRVRFTYSCRDSKSSSEISRSSTLWRRCCQTLLGRLAN